MAIGSEYVEVVKKWKVPTTTREVEQFLGFANYHRTFIKNFADLSYPLYQLTGKKPYKWRDSEQEAFDKLVEALTTTPLLALPNNKDPFILDTDASNFAIGAELIQVQDGVERPVAYGSFSLTHEQKRYCTTRKELLAVVKFTRHYRHYLLGREFIVRTDHSSLTWLLHFKEPQGQLARWLEELSQYHMTVKHRPGKRHQNADALSRLPDLACPQNRLAAGNMLKTQSTLWSMRLLYSCSPKLAWFSRRPSHQDCKSFEPIGPHTVLPSSLISDDNLLKQDNTQHIHVITEDNTRPDSSIPQDEDQNVTSHVKENLSTFQVQQQVFESTNQDIVNQNQNVCHSSVEIVTTPLGMSVYATYLDFPNVNAITETGIEASTYSPEQLRDYQSKDPDLELILVWFRDKTEPSEATIFRCSPIAKKYWINKDMFYLDDNGILRNLDKKDRTPRLVVPRDLVEQVISLCHDIPAAGHQGMNRTTLRIKAKYQWYGMTQKIRDFVKTCSTCNLHKKPNRKAKCPLTQFHAGAPMERVHLDFLGPLPETKFGNAHVLVMVDQFSKWMECIPLPAQTQSIRQELQ
ncbi:Hypothetical predicted protein [Mytilus galloprovincialis]|uniref:Integrase catalytic domain-containing protein n=1 Tax=Mytilus galloprovincialis TaxID=29158 RepID=A0A8B6E2I8_MYTGA|nr:Hypothetical predicted protein [Mytilus galloprovincialis]